MSDVTQKTRGLRMSRRRFLQAAAAGAALPGTLGLLGGEARAQAGGARRFLVFYFPDGVPGDSQEGDRSLWHIHEGGEADFALPDLLAPLAPYRERSVFFRGLSMGDADNGSHPGGAQKLLTAVDRGNGESVDRVLARTIGADAPHRHVYLGVQAAPGGASGDKAISYVAPGNTVAAQDDPVQAFGRLFGGGLAVEPGAPPVDVRQATRRSVLDVMRADLESLRGRVAGRGRSRLELHLDAVRELELRLAPMADPDPPPQMGDRCGQVPAPVAAIDQGALYDPARFPAILEAQTEVMVRAMACGLTRVGVIQCSHHTTDLLMSAFPGTPMAAEGIYMRSHEASHYGARHDLGDPKFRSFVAQRRWFVERYAALLGRLAEMPEGDGTMLDHTVVLLCTEVCDGNTHQHHDMPFVVSGGEAGGVRTGRLLRFGFRRHGDLYAGLGRALGADFARFGDAGEGPLPGLVA